MLERLPALPVAIANNAVAAVPYKQGHALYSFLGLLEGKTWRDVSARAFVLEPGASQWQALPSVPGDVGRLAGAAVAVGGYVYVFGGYTVAEDHSETSVETVHRLRAGSSVYETVAAMPVPVDDSVALAHADRYIYLVSGWHDSGNVNLVQLFDTRTGVWRQATPYPGTPVFGHAGGIIDGVMVICDGVKIVSTSGQREFAAANECYRGDIRPDDPRRIDWKTLPPHPGAPRYRMAAGVWTEAGVSRIVFAGGSDNPYNYDGVGYDGEPSKASARVVVWGPDAGWREAGTLPVATMDHRGLLVTDKGLVIVGGMRDGQRVSAEVLRFRLPGQ